MASYDTWSIFTLGQCLGSVHGVTRDSLWMDASAVISRIHPYTSDLDGVPSASVTNAIRKHLSIPDLRQPTAGVSRQLGCSWLLELLAGKAPFAVVNEETQPRLAKVSYENVRWNKISWFLKTQPRCQINHSLQGENLIHECKSA